MQVRLIHVTQRRSGAKARREQVLTTDRLTVGRGTDNAVSVSGLAIPLHHSLFAPSADGVYVEAIGRSNLRVNGSTTGRQRVQPGDVVRVGSTELRVQTAGPGEDLVLEVETVAAPINEAAAAALRPQVGVERGLFTRRKLSWAVVLLVPTLLLLVPLVARRAVPPLPVSEKLSARLPLPPAPRSPWQRLGLWVEASWSSGPLSTAHANLAGACVTCHRDAFEPVRDEECVQCHPSLGHHAREAARGASNDDRACTFCHVEHDGDPGLLGFGSEMCTSCHADLKTSFPQSELLDVRDFSRHHVQFRPSVVVGGPTNSGKQSPRPSRRPQEKGPPQGERKDSFQINDPTVRPEEPPSSGGVSKGGASNWRAKPVVGGPTTSRPRISLDQLPLTGAPAADAVQERSGLKFSHSKHLRPNLRGPRGEAVTLECQACHVAERAGQLMQPPRFVEHCQSCHPLSFDGAYPARQVPHKQPQWIEEYTFELYAAQILQGEEQESTAPSRRRPGAPLSVQERDATMALASSRAAQANTYLLGPNGVCAVCHTLTHENNQVAVAPVVVVPTAHAERWLPLSRFDHALHAMATCRDCHAADTAETAGVVILPGVDACRSCHGDQGIADEVPSSCMQCHRYHHADRGKAEGSR